jgi:hypothetical protein
MIDAVRQKLKEMNKECCISLTLHGQESGKSVNLDPRGKAIKIRVDGCLIKDTKKCDCLYFYQHSPSKKYVFLVELKGKRYSTALEQIDCTLKHQTYIDLFKAADPNKKYAVAIVSKNANTNRPAKDDWENETGYRLKVFACDNNQSIELVEKVIKD